jgi:MFS family permease
MILGSAILMLVHFLFMSTQLPPYIPMIMLGIAFSLVPAAMWPSVARIVDENRLGTAYGLMFSIQNLGLWGFPIMAGIILDNTNKGTEGALNYGPTMLMFLILGSAGMVFALLLRRYSIRNGRGLDKPMKPADEKKEK